MDVFPREQQSSLVEEIRRQVTAENLVAPIDAGKFYICGIADFAGDAAAAKRFLIGGCGAEKSSTSRSRASLKIL
jgi:hypothetical protein